MPLPKALARSATPMLTICWRMLTVSPAWAARVLAIEALSSRERKAIAKAVPRSWFISPRSKTGTESGQPPAGDGWQGLDRLPPAAEPDAGEGHDDEGARHGRQEAQELLDEEIDRDGGRREGQGGPRGCPGWHRGCCGRRRRRCRTWPASTPSTLGSWLTMMRKAAAVMYPVMTARETNWMTTSALRRAPEEHHGGDQDEDEGQHDELLVVRQSHRQVSAEQEDRAGIGRPEHQEARAGEDRPGDRPDRGGVDAELDREAGDHGVGHALGEIEEGDVDAGLEVAPEVARTGIPVGSRTSGMRSRSVGRRSGGAVLMGASVGRWGCGGRTGQLSLRRLAGFSQSRAWASRRMPGMRSAKGLVSRASQQRGLVEARRRCCPGTSGRHCRAGCSASCANSDHVEGLGVVPEAEDLVDVDVAGDVLLVGDAAPPVRRTSRRRGRSCISAARRAAIGAVTSPASRVVRVERLDVAVEVGRAGRADAQGVDLRDGKAVEVVELHRVQRAGTARRASAGGS